MPVLLLRLAGPLQAWGSTSKFNRRATEREPTHSGVVGLLAAALGRRRTDPLDDLAALRFAVRVDQPGRIIRDFHTARPGEEQKDSPFVSERLYLSDAVFLVGLEGESAFLEKLDDALRCPAFPLFLGRRSCPPAGRVSLGLRDGVLEDVLHEEGWQAARWFRRRQPAHVSLEVVRDAAPDESGAFTRRDFPLSFSMERRRHGFRAVRSAVHAVTVENPDARTASNLAGPPTDHDAYSSTEGDDVSLPH